MLVGLTLRDFWQLRISRTLITMSSLVLQGIYSHTVVLYTCITDISIITVTQISVLYIHSAIYNVYQYCMSHWGDEFGKFNKSHCDDISIVYHTVLYNRYQY